MLAFVTLLLAPGAAAPLLALDPPVITATYETARGIEEDDEEDLLPDYVRHTVLVNARQEFGERARITAPVRVTRRREPLPAGPERPRCRPCPRRGGVAGGVLGAGRAGGAGAGCAAVLVVVSYFPALQGGFVWDDVIFSEEPVTHSPGALRSIWSSPTDIKNEGHYWPPAYSSFWLEHRLWGLQSIEHALALDLEVARTILANLRKHLQQPSRLNPDH